MCSSSPLSFYGKFFQFLWLNFEFTGKFPRDIAPPNRRRLPISGTAMIYDHHRGLTVGVRRRHTMVNFAPAKTATQKLKRERERELGKLPKLDF
jgi:hypothetical protein